MSNPTKILVKLTTRERPERCFKTLDSVYNLASRPDFIRVLVTMDFNDASMYNNAVVERLNEYKNLHMVYGVSDSKVMAINRDLDKLPKDFRDWKLLSNVSDDMVYCTFGWDDILRADANQYHPDYDCYLSYLDSDTRGALTTQLNIGRAYYERFNFLYNPAYLSLFCDNEADEVAKMLGKYHFTGIEIYKHYNSAYGYSDYPRDALFEQQQTIGWSIDNLTYNERKTRNFDLNIKQ